MTTQMVPPTQKPDWSSITEEICCPLCGYNLQGLAEPRCPECGYAFEWLDLTDSTRRLHPYLFEHHPEKNIRSFWRTATGAMLPRRFWRKLQPVQPSRPRRLILYWLLTCLICFALLNLSLLALGSIIVYAQLLDNQSYRAAFMNPKTQWPVTDPELGIHGIVTDPVLKRKLADKHYPDHVTWQMLKVVIAQSYRQWLGSQCLLLPLLWPWMMFSSLMIFQWSMRRAKVRPIHVLRCCIYSGGTMVWIGIAGAIMLGVAIVEGPGLAMWSIAGVGAAVVGFLVLLMLYQLITAYRLYLRFDHAIATILSALIIAILVPFTAFTVAWVLLYC